MLNGLAEAAKNDKIDFNFEITIVLDQLDNEDADIASSAAECIANMVDGRRGFLQHFDITAFLDSLGDLYFSKTKFNSKKYVAKAILALISLQCGHDLVIFMEKGVIEVLTFLMDVSLKKQGNADIITVERIVNVVDAIFQASKIYSSTKLREAISSFDDCEGFTMICDVFDKYSHLPMVTNKLKEMLDVFMEEYAPEEYRGDGGDDE